MIDVEEFVKPLSEEEPCGPSLVYDPDYMELEKLAEGEPERTMGESVIEAVEPNWKEIAKRSRDLLQRTRDLRLIVLLTTGQLEAEGFPGLRDGLRLCRETLEHSWDHVHPKLDPDDDNDPTERLNILASLATPTTALGDPLKFVDKVQDAPLTNSKALGRIGLRDVLIATGEIDAPAHTEDDQGEPPPSGETVRAAFEDTTVEDLAVIAEAVDEGLEEVKRIDSFQMETVGSSSAIDVSPLTAVLKSAQKIVKEQLAVRGAGDGEGGGGSEEGGAPGDSAPAARLTGEISSREDVVRALEKICRYYEQHEPSSPVPIMVRRVQRQVGRPFVEIMRDLAPTGMSEIETIAGERFSEE